MSMSIKIAPPEGAEIDDRKEQMLNAVSETTNHIVSTMTEMTCFVHRAIEKHDEARTHCVMKFREFLNEYGGEIVTDPEGYCAKLVLWSRDECEEFLGVKRDGVEVPEVLN